MARPLLDVTEVLVDPMFQDTEIWVTRMAETVVNGIGQLTPTTTQFSGVVVQESGIGLARREDGTRQSDSINIYTRTDLISGEDGRAADQILWQGRNYTVTRVLDWSTYGRGFRRAICDLLDIVPGAGDG